MKVGYARVSAFEQNLDMPSDALKEKSALIMFSKVRFPYGLEHPNSLNARSLEGKPALC